MPPRPTTGPTTTVVRLPKAQVAAAEAATGLRGGQAVRARLDGLPHQGAPVVSCACQRLPGQIGVDAPALGSTERVVQVGIGAGDNLDQVVVKGNGRVEAQALYPDGLSDLDRRDIG